ncbi:MAG: hypothetical protein FWC32_09900 [Firmicutes bacterium]|nr:hypothetical protein [Bacillota bacterium]
MITIKQLATELGVCKQAVYNRITKEPLKSKLIDMGCEPQISNNGTIILSDSCADAIRSVYAEVYSFPNTSSVQGGYGRRRMQKKPAGDELNMVLSQLENIQAMMSKMAQMESLQAALNQKEVESAELSGIAETLKIIVSEKNAQLDKLHEKYTEAIAHIKLYQAQVMALKKQLPPKETELHPALHIAK